MSTNPLRNPLDLYTNILIAQKLQDKTEFSKITL